MKALGPETERIAIYRKDFMNATNQPNIVFLMVDQMGTKWLKAAMNGICDLPNLRHLQSMGVTFTNAFSNNPV